MRSVLLILLVCACFTASPVFADSACEEVPPDHWAYFALDYLYDRGLLTSIHGDFSSGDRKLTRGELATITVQALESYVAGGFSTSAGPVLQELAGEFVFELGYEQNPPQKTPVEYPRKDEIVPLDHWAYNAMDYLVQRGILPAIFDDTFNKSRTLTRYEFARFTSLLLQIEGAAGDTLQEDENGSIRVMAETLRAEFSTQIY